MWNVCMHFTTSAKAHGSEMFTWASQTSITGSFWGRRPGGLQVGRRGAVKRKKAEVIAPACAWWLRSQSPSGSFLDLQGCAFYCLVLLES